MIALHQLDKVPGEVPVRPLLASPDSDPLGGDGNAVVVPPDAVKVPRRGILPRRSTTGAAPARTTPQGGVTRDTVPVKVAHVGGATTQDGPTVAEDGEERGGGIPLAALRCAQSRVRAGNPPTRPEPYPALPV